VFVAGTPSPALENSLHLLCVHCGIFRPFSWFFRGVLW
jgi:hypothetical protein